MFFGLRKYCMRATSNVLYSDQSCMAVSFSTTTKVRTKNSDFLSGRNSELGTSSILLEAGTSFEELPVLVKNIWDVFDYSQNDHSESDKLSYDCYNFHLIQSEFNQCNDLKDVFALLSKCIKITPNIALGAVERIHSLENEMNLSQTVDTRNLNTNLAKGAILSKLLNIILKTEDTQTLLNALNIVSLFMEPYKYRFCNELLVRLIDNKLSIEQICDFIVFLSKDRKKFVHIIDKLWVGFVEKEKDINEKNIVSLFHLLPHLKVSKRVVMNLLEKKLVSTWEKIGPLQMVEILNILYCEKHVSNQSLDVIGRWLNTNIHVLNEDTLLDIVTKLTKLRYTDTQIEKALEKYIRMKNVKIDSQMLIIGILNHCLEFRLRNHYILSGCSKFYSEKGFSVPHFFLPYCVLPFGYLYFKPNNSQFWILFENILMENFDKISIDNILSIMLACIYVEHYPISFISNLFSPYFLNRISKSENVDRLLRKLKLIDTALSLEYKNYNGPLIPKNHLSMFVVQDRRIEKIVINLKENLKLVAIAVDKIYTKVLVPNLFADETYTIDIMLHYRLENGRTKEVAMLIHLPEHYCHNTEQLIGPQEMRKRHLNLLGLNVVSLKYTTLRKLDGQGTELEKYILQKIKKAESL